MKNTPHATAGTAKILAIEFDNFYNDPTPGKAVALATADLEFMGYGTPEFFAHLNKAKGYDALKASHGELVRLCDLINQEFKSDPMSTQCFDRSIVSGISAALLHAKGVQSC